MGKIPASVKEKIQQIKADNTSGASVLTGVAAETLKLLARECKAEDPAEFRDLLYKTAVQLIQAQPVMASIFSLVNSILMEYNEFRGKVSFQEAKLPDVCDQFITAQNTAEDRMKTKAAGVIRDGHVLLTHSYSSNVLATLQAACKAGRKFEVICTESRPANEGVILAEQLGKEGISVQLITEAAIPLMLERVNTIFVGADAVSERFITNKIGTYSLALAAQSGKADFYVLCTTHKLVPQNLNLLAQQRKPDSELLIAPPKNVQPVNYYYENTPIRFCDGFITEHGIIKPSKLQQRL
ncbi:MAG: translation initiation factor eIF-2B, partial [Lentisphaeria bacterium]